MSFETGELHISSFSSSFSPLSSIFDSSSSSSSLCDGLLPGGISGLYYHKSSEKFQSLSLRHVDDKVDVGTFDFV